MGGNAGIRGYLIQTIICVLDALADDNEWISVTLEPLDESEKVDIRWRYLEDKIKLCQVKSSQNIIRLSKAKKWCDDIERESPGANDYELIIIGHPEEKLLNTKKQGNVRIVGFKGLNTDDLLDQASTKIDRYYENKGKSKISASVREILVKTLTTQFASKSIVGSEINRLDFDTQLLDWISAIEKQIETNPFASLAIQNPNEIIPFNHRIAKKIIELIGWTNFSENIKVEEFNEKTTDTDEFLVDFYGDFESALKEKTDDIVFITSYHDLVYPNTSKDQIKKYLFSSEKVFNELKRTKKVPINRNENTEYHNILFWLTTENAELDSDFIHHAKENYKNNLLENDTYYYLVDNAKANFLISSIITAKNYEPDLPVKFLYPITDANQSPDRIGTRGKRLPVQFINSSIIPIIKESSAKISILLFCADSFDELALRKLIWLTIRLTSGLGNEYLIYFPDFEEAHRNTAKDVIRSFNDSTITDKIIVKKYHGFDAKVLDGIPNVESGILNIESFDETTGVVKNMNEAFFNILPYGDILKPFLKTDSIMATDIKFFLEKKGVFMQGADRTKLIALMATLLFSPKELEDFKDLIEVKDRSVNTTNEIFQVKKDDTLQNVFNKINLNFDNLTEDLGTKLLNPPIFIENQENPNEFILTVDTEKKDATSQLLVNSSWGKVEVICTKEDDKFIVNKVNTISREDKYIANRIVKEVESEFKRLDFVKDETIKVKFSDFADNKERVNFLLSYTDVSSSSMFKDPDIQSIKFQFDSSKEIPEAFKDKKDKDLITYFSGRNLAGLNEISDEEFKKVLLLEEVKINYKYDHFNIQNGYYTVKYNFSDALKGKGDKDGVFRSEGHLFMSDKVKQLSNIDGLKKQLSKEIERIKLEKLKLFNIIE